MAGVDGREGARKNRLAHAFRLAAEHIQTSSRQDLLILERGRGRARRRPACRVGHHIMAQSAA